MSGGAEPGCSVTLAVLYLFAGAERQADFNLALHTAVDELRGSEESVFVKLEMVDILRGGSDHDLGDIGRQASFLERIDAGEFDVVIATPPCNTFSRSLFNRLPGPRPKRDMQWPWGFPWLSPSDRESVQVANSLLSFSVDCLGRASGCGTTTGASLVASSSTQRTWALLTGGTRPPSGSWTASGHSRSCTTAGGPFSSARSRTLTTKNRQAC